MARWIIMEEIIKLLTDPENQPHQFVGEPEKLKELIEEAIKKEPKNQTMTKAQIIEEMEFLNGSKLLRAEEKYGQSNISFMGSILSLAYKSGKF